MELISDRKKAIPAVMEWIKSNLPLNETVNFSRDTVSEVTRATPAIVSRVFLVLINHDYLKYKQYRNAPGAYRLIKDVSSLDNGQIDRWIKEYQQEKDRDRRARLAGVSPESVATANTPTEPVLPLTPSREFQMTEEKPEAPKSRSQQLLDEADRLRQLAQEEAQREANEAQKGTEMPGTVPELLTLLDSRVDGVESRFDILEKKVNTVLYFFQQASYAVRSLAPVGPPEEPVQVVTPQPEPAAEPTTRNLLVRLVNSYAAADRKTEHDTWKWLYGQFDLRKGFNVYAQAGPSAKGKDESYLAVVEQHGKIDELYKLAKRLMVLPELR